MNKLYLIGNGHLDPVWLWRWQEGFAEIKATFKSALDRMEEYPDFVFTSACASYYKWIEENEPEMFEQIKQRIAQGKWNIAGGWWIQPDCNIPSGESFARHGLYSQRYFKEKFNKTATVGYNVDSFGHNGMLPQILKKSGMDYYVFHRPGDDEKILNNNVFNWESLDGSSVIAFKIPYGYGHGNNIDQELDEKIQGLTQMSDEQDVPFMFFYGVGNHGGGPTRVIIEDFNKKQEKLGKDKFNYASVNEYFEDIKDGKFATVSEDLQHHASGCYSTVAQIKTNNRRSENRLGMAEKAAVLANKLLGLEYKKADLQKAWEDVMFNQFHDIMGGCSIEESYEDAREFHGEALKISGDVLNASYQKMSWAIDTMGDEEFLLSKDMDGALWEMGNRGVPIVVFNPHSWEVTAPVVCTRSVASVTDSDNNPVASQAVRASQTNGEEHNATMFMATIPAMGYKTYKIYLKKEIEAPKSTNLLEFTDTTLENNWFKIEFDAHTGYMKSLFSKENNIEMLCSDGAVPVVIDDFDTDTWAHKVFEFRNETGRFNDAKVFLLEKGELKATVRVVNYFGKSTMQQDFTIYRDIKNIDVKVKVNWQEELKILKLSYPVNISDTKAVYEIPYGYIEKDANGQEEAGQQFFAVEGKLNDAICGLGITNDSKYSYDVKDNDMRITLLRSAYFADHFGQDYRDEFNQAMDIGIHNIKYSIIPFTGKAKDAGLTKKGMEMNSPLTSIIETYHKGSLPLEASYLSVSEDNIVLQAMKMAEDSEDTVLRFTEIAGKDTTVDIDFKLIGKKFNANFGHNEIKTFIVSENQVKEVNLLEE